MRCDAARERLLVADPDVLAGAGDGPLARHLRSCAGCRDAARRILEQQRALADALAGLGPRRAPPSPAESGTPPTARATTEQGPRHRAARHPWVAAILAAAGLAGLLLLGPRQEEGPVPDEAGPPAEATAEGGEAPGGTTALRVEVPPGRRAAVFDTQHPGVTVVWFF